MNCWIAGIGFAGSNMTGWICRNRSLIEWSKQRPGWQRRKGFARPLESARKKKSTDSVLVCSSKQCSQPERFAAPVEYWRRDLIPGDIYGLIGDGRGGDCAHASPDEKIFDL